LEADELLYYYALSLSSGIGAGRLVAIRTYFGDSIKAFSANARKLASIPGVGKLTAEEWIATRHENLVRAREHLAKLPETASIITFFDPDYPESLRSTFNPPALLWLNGERSLLQAERIIAVIGTRRITDYGKRVTKDVCVDLAGAGVTIVSGLALGVDTVGQRSIYEAGGSTIGVLGSGMNVIYPPSNKAFAAELVQSGRGLIASELALGTKPDAKNFPWRNRIVSGLAAATVVIESDEKGGSMITASIALDQDRDVFALPGDVDRPMSRGPNLLLAEGRAKPFRNAQDILKGLGWLPDSLRGGKSAPKAHAEHLSGDQKKLYQLLTDAGEPLNIDAIIERSEIDVQTVLVRLLELEFKDMVRQLPGKHFTTIF
jgi:DNA processing protein